MSTSSINSLLSSLNPSTNESLAELLGESSTSNSTATNASNNAVLQDAVNAILNSATNTAGSGIDVTSTVDAILQIDAQPEVNLQSQVTALNAQTTALQAIETDLTALQTSVQALTDPDGAFSAVAVTSSNNDVVSATAEAGTTPGSHTVVVNSLATTAAEYSAPQTSSTSALPVAGGFDLQVGTNAAVPIPVDSADNTGTLSGLAKYINDQNIGVTASVITDSSGAILSLVSQTSGTAGKITISNDTTAADLSGVFTSGSAQLPTGSFDLQVGSNSATIPVDSADGTNTLTGLASYITQLNLGVTASVVTNGSGVSLALVPQNSAAAGVITVSNDTTGMGFPAVYDPSNADYSAPFTSESAQLPTGSFDLQVGSNSAVTIPVDSGDGTNTLTGLADYITQLNLGVTASVFTNTSGASLALVPQSSGAAGVITVSNDTTGMGFPAVYTPPSSPTGGGMGFQAATQEVNGSPVDLGTNASLTVDGVPVTSGSNTLTGVIPGVTLTLSGASTTPVTLAIQPDLTQVSTAINNFVTAYNQVMTDINTQYTDSGTSSTVPPLLGDPSLDLLQSQLLNGITTSISGNNGLVNLQSIGIQLQDDGTLTVASSSSPDSMDLNDALANDFSAVQNLFQSTSTSSPGVAQALNTALTAITDPTNGPLNLDMSGINSQVTDLNTQISNFQYQLQQTQTQLTAEYTTINTTLEQLPETLASINQQLNALNPPGTSNG
jgi:flagellar hook-associated protein 2